jgi:hypothetical protein
MSHFSKATILFCDIVGFSKHHGDEQHFQMKLVYGLGAEITHELYPHLTEFRSKPSVICIPTGDGMAIVLLEKNPLEGNSQQANRILLSLLHRLMAWATTRHFGIENKLRIGVHYGDVIVLADVNRGWNVSGDCINTCQRVMDAANDNQVLFSKQACMHHCGEDFLTFTEQTGSGPKSPYEWNTRTEFNTMKIIGGYEIEVKHGVQHVVYVVHPRRASRRAWVETPPKSRKEVATDIVRGRPERADLIASELEGAINRPGENLTIFEQAAFSTFSIADQSDWLEEEAMPPASVIKKLVRQKKLMQQLAMNPTTRLRLILQPNNSERKPSVDILCLTTLIEWMEEIEGRANIEFVISEFEIPNRLMLVQEGHNFCIEGYKRDNVAGFELSIVERSPNKVKAFTDSFDRYWTHLKLARENLNKREVINYLKAQRLRRIRNQRRRRP